jgi:hypothetical protein
VLNMHDNTRGWTASLLEWTKCPFIAGGQLGK